MNRTELFDAGMAACPLVAILRGVRPDEVVGVADALVEAGFSMIEVPLNSPDPLDSISRIANRYPAPVVVGAGTVIDVDQVEAVSNAGGRLIVSPNTNAEVIAAAKAADLVSLPGYFTPSEAFLALRSGASGLKLFPADGSSPAFLKAQRAVLPPTTRILVVGGITSSTMTPWRSAGADGFGLGSALYKPGADPTTVAAAAADFISAWKSDAG